MILLAQMAAVVVLSAVLAAVVTPLWARYAVRIGLVVRPREDRWHRSPTPLLGGAGIALAALLILAIVLPPGGRSLTVLAGGLLAVLLGLTDDFRHVAPSTKLVGQAMIGALLVFGDIRVEIVEVEPIAFVLTILWVVGLMNAVNLLDNMDGLASGVAAIAAVVLSLYALPEDPFAAAVAAATAGAAIGFLVHNFHPARVFMGDAGSQMLGYLLATTALLNTASGAANVGLTVFGPLLVLTLPIFDTTLVTLTRRLAGRPIVAGGRDHVSHRLAALGLSDRGAVLVLYGLAGAFAVFGLTLELLAQLVAPLIALSLVGLVLFGLFLSEVDVYSLGAGDRQLAARTRAIARFGTEVALDIVLLTTAYYVSYTIRYEGQPERDWLGFFTSSVPIVVGAQLGALVLFGVYRTLWRYLGVGDAVAITRATVIGTAAAALGVVLAFRWEGYSRAVFVLDGIIATVLIVGARAFLLWLRHAFAVRAGAKGRRVLIVGANDAGAVALQLLTRSAESAYQVIGFLDDDPGKRYRRVGGIPVIGTTEEFPTKLDQLKPDVIVVSDVDPQVRAQVWEQCTIRGIECRDFGVPA